MHSALKRVFWPVNATKGRTSPGWVIGWQNSENDYFVFAVLNEESVKVAFSMSASNVRLILRVLPWLL
jgi:hypothetical protein